MRSRDQRGFTTIELLEAVALCGIAVVGLSSLLLATMHGNLRARDVTAASTVAETKIEELRGASFDSLANGSDAVTFGGIGFTRSWTVTSGPTSATREVRVEVTEANPEFPAVHVSTIIGG